MDDDTNFLSVKRGKLFRY